jgi:hypothetical protein
MSNILLSSDLRVRLGPVRDQGARPTCLAFAVSDAHAAARAPEWEPLSCEYLFFHAKGRDKAPIDGGTTMKAIREALAEDGQPVESAWPYLDALPADLLSWTPPVDIAEVFRRDSTPQGSAFGHVWQEIENGRLVVLAMTLSNSFYTPDAFGVVDTVEAPNPVMRHAVVAAGTGHGGTQRFLLVRNSWGESWGISGYAWLSEVYAADKISATLTLE